VLQRKGLCTKHDLYDIITASCRKNSRANIPETAFPERYLFTEAEDAIVDDLLALHNKRRLISHQTLNLPKRLGQIIEMGHRW